MKAKQIEIGQLYSVGTENYSRRARITAVGTFKKRVYSSGRDFHGHTTEIHGAYAEFLGRDDQVVSEEWVRLAEVRETWDAHDYRETDRRERAGRIDATYRAIEARAAQRGVRIYISRATGEARLSALDLQVLMDTNE